MFSGKRKPETSVKKKIHQANKDISRLVSSRERRFQMMVTARMDKRSK